MTDCDIVKKKKHNKHCKFVMLFAICKMVNKKTILLSPNKNGMHPWAKE